jgi:hypothetical protein
MQLNTILISNASNASMWCDFHHCRTDTVIITLTLYCCCVDPLIIMQTLSSLHGPFCHFVDPPVIAQTLCHYCMDPLLLLCRPPFIIIQTSFIIVWTPFIVMWTLCHHCADSPLSLCRTPFIVAWTSIIVQTLLHHCIGFVIVWTSLHYRADCRDSLLTTYVEAASDSTMDLSWR